MQLAGRELTADVIVSDLAEKEERDLVRAALRAGAHALGATLLSEHDQVFQPSGVTGVVIIGESHLLASTYPELDLVAVNIQTCSPDMTILDGLTAICRTLDAQLVRSVMVKRHVDVPLEIESFHRDVPFVDGALCLEQGQLVDFGPRR